MNHIICAIFIFLDLFRLDDQAVNLMKISRPKIYTQLDLIENEISLALTENIVKFIEKRQGQFFK